MLTHYIKDQSGKTHPCVFTTAVLAKLARMERIPQDEIFKFWAKIDKWELSTLYRMYWLMMKVGAVTENKPFDLTEEEFEDWILVKDRSLLPQITDIMSSSLVEVVEELTGQKKTKKK